MGTGDFPTPYVGVVKQISFFVTMNIIRFQITDLSGSEIHVSVRSAESIPLSLEVDPSTSLFFPSYRPLRAYSFATLRHWGRYHFNHHRTCRAYRFTILPLEHLSSFTDSPFAFSEIDVADGSRPEMETAPN